MTQIKIRQTLSPLRNALSFSKPQLTIPKNKDVSNTTFPLRQILAVAQRHRHIHIHIHTHWDQNIKHGNAALYFSFSLSSGVSHSGVKAFCHTALVTPSSQGPITGVHNSRAIHAYTQQIFSSFPNAFKATEDFAERESGLPQLCNYSGVMTCES